MGDFHSSTVSAMLRSKVSFAYSLSGRVLHFEMMQRGSLESQQGEPVHSVELCELLEWHNGERRSEI